jgi:transglutaminase-like putative cysteine protease
VRALRRMIVAAVAICVLGVTGLSQDPIELVLERAERASVSPASDAVILLDAGRTTVLPDGRRESVGHEQILLLSWEAIDAYGQVEIPYSEDLEEFTLVYGRTILPSGEVVELGEAGIRVSSYAEGGGEEAYSELKTVTLSMPSLRPGVVIDYEYVFTDEVPEIEDEFFDCWYFEWWDPVQLSEYVLDVPNDLDFEWRVGRRVLEPEIQSTSERTVYTFRVEDVEPLQYEVDMPSELAVGSFAAVSSLASWDEIATWWWGLAKDKMVATQEVAAQAGELTSGATTDDERISRLYDFVAREVRYVALRLGESGYEPRPAAETLATRYGDCKDQATLLVALLDSAGIDAYPVLISGELGYHMDWSEPPSPMPFDHVVVAVPTSGGGWRFLDPTCSVCTADFTDDVVRDRGGVLVTEDPAALGVRVYTGEFRASESMVQCSLAGSLTPDDLLTLEAEVDASGNYDVAYRRIVLNYRPSEREDLFAVFADLAVPQSTLLDYEYSDLDDTHTPVNLRIGLEKERFVRWIAGGLGLLSLPYGPAFPFPEYFSDTIVLAERTYPLLTLVSRMELHAGIDVGDRRVAELPADVLVDNRVGSFRSSYALEGSTIVYERALQFDVPEILPEDYPLYQGLIQAMLEDVEAMAVLRE